MKMQKKTKRRVIALSLTAIFLIGIGAGLWFFIKNRNDQKTVEVLPVSQVADYYWPEQSMCSGMVVSDYVQQLYPEYGKTISAVFVEEGQHVSVGDPLLQYDKEQLELEVRFKDLALQEADLNLSTAQKQLKRLQNTKPASSSTPRPIVTPRPTSTPRPGASARPTATPRPSATSTPVPPGTATAYKRLDLNSKPYEGKGTSDDPYIFLCTSDCIVTPEFLAWLLGNAPAATPTPAPTAEPLPSPTPEAEKDDDTVEFPEASAPPTPTPAPTPVPTPIPVEFSSPFAAVFEVRTGNSNLGSLLSSFRLDGIQLSGGFHPGGSLNGFNTLETLEQLFGATPTPKPSAKPSAKPTSAPDNYNDMGYTAAELRELIAEKRREIAELQNARKQAKLDLDKANLQLRNSTVLSTIDGVVTTLMDPSEASMGMQPFLVVSAGGSTTYVKGAIIETLLGIIQVGDHVSVMDYWMGGEYTAEIVNIADYPLDSDAGLYYYGSGNPNSTTYEFTAVVLDENELTSGRYVDITLVVSDQEAANALYIQKAYVREDTAGSYVMKSGPDGRLVKQYVRTGRTLYGSSVEIKSGLTINDYIAFPYGTDVKEGVRTVLPGSEEAPVTDEPYVPGIGVDDSDIYYSPSTGDGFTEDLPEGGPIVLPEEIETETEGGDEDA